MYPFYVEGDAVYIASIILNNFCLNYSTSRTFDTGPLNCEQFSNTEIFHQMGHVVIEFTSIENEKDKISVFLSQNGGYEVFSGLRKPIFGKENPIYLELTIHRYQKQ